MSPIRLQRLGQLIEPEPGNPQEIEGVLNPAAVRGPDGNLYLFPRLVAKGNYSRIGICRVRFNAGGDPCGVERLGIALEPEADYERRPEGGGCEDPRITFVEPLGHHVMTYTAHSSIGPRIALAISEDLFHWQRVGLAAFAPYRGVDFVHVDNKDASVFPTAIPNHHGKMQLAMLHRPLFTGTRPEDTACQPAHRLKNLDHESIWVSYCPMPAANLAAFHHLDAPWRPADIEQREGRIVRQGNQNEFVSIFRYVTEGSFDAYMWQTLENKCRFIAQVMNGDATVRRAEDVDAGR